MTVKNFENFGNYIDMSKVVLPKAVETKLYVLRLELAFPLIKDFSQTHVPGREFNNTYHEAKDFNYEEDIKGVIDKNKAKILKKKAHATFTLLAIGNHSVVVGLEINKDQGPENISRFVGNFLSRDLFHDKKWFLLVNTHNHLFNVKEIKEYVE
jgi:hypothetical protein